MNRLRIATAASMLTCICFTGCSTTNKQGPVTTEQQSARDQLESQRTIAAQTAQTYHAMDTPTLVNKLVAESAAKKEPFNSLAYRELRKRTDVSAESLASVVREKKNGDALLPLLLLRKLHEKDYLTLPVELRAGVLTDALQNSQMFNTWGIPPFYLEDASKAMLETDQAAIPALRRMLSDTRPAPVFGSQEYMVYLRYQYRVCDYALFFLENLQGNGQFKMPTSPAERDSLIKGLSK